MIEQLLQPRAQRRMCITAGIEEVHMSRPGELRELNIVACCPGGLNVVSGHLDWQHLIHPAVNDQLIHAKREQGDR